MNWKRHISIGCILGLSIPVFSFFYLRFAFEFGEDVFMEMFPQFYGPLYLFETEKLLQAIAYYVLRASLYIVISTLISIVIGLLKSKLIQGVSWIALFIILMFVLWGKGQQIINKNAASVLSDDQRYNSFEGCDSLEPYDIKSCYVSLYKKLPASVDVCNKVLTVDERRYEQCAQRVGNLLEDIEVCKTFERQEAIDSCIYGIRAEKKTDEICSQIMTERYRYNCFHDVAIATLHFESCFQIPDDSDHDPVKNRGHCIKEISIQRGRQCETKECKKEICIEIIDPGDNGVCLHWLNLQ